MRRTVFTLFALSLFVVASCSREQPKKEEPERTVAPAPTDEASGAPETAAPAPTAETKAATVGVPKNGVTLKKRIGPAGLGVNPQLRTMPNRRIPAHTLRRAGDGQLLIQPKIDGSALGADARAERRKAAENGEKPPVKPLPTDENVPPSEGDPAPAEEGAAPPTP